jgi:hypothetical protein
MQLAEVRGVGIFDTVTIRIDPWRGASRKLGDLVKEILG